jgi:hypothetical protein
MGVCVGLSLRSSHATMPSPSKCVIGQRLGQLIRGFIPPLVA